MNFLAIVSLLLLLAMTAGAQVAEEPTLKIQASSKGVALIWTESEEASQYLVSTLG